MRQSTSQRVTDGPIYWRRTSLSFLSFLLSSCGLTATTELKIRKSLPRLPSAWGYNLFQRNIFEGNQRWTWFRRTCQLKTIFLEHDCEGKRQIQKSLQQCSCQSKCWVRSRCWICLIGGSNWTKIWEMWTMLSESALTGIKERKDWSTDEDVADDIREMLEQLWGMWVTMSTIQHLIQSLFDVPAKMLFDEILWITSITAGATATFSLTLLTFPEPKLNSWFLTLSWCKQFQHLYSSKTKEVHNTNLVLTAQIAERNPRL